jgi:hypothetical protein
MFSQMSVWFCITAAKIIAIIPDIITKILETLFERREVNKIRDLELGRIFSAQYPGYPQNPTKETLLNAMKQNKRISLSKGNKVGATSYDNKAFINDNFQLNSKPNCIEGQEV